MINVTMNDDLLFAETSETPSVAYTLSSGGGIGGGFGQCATLV